MDRIRNFCIIAHIDHGKSTLADRMMELTNTVEKREMKAQLLDSMELERERGITIKLTPVSMKWKLSDTGEPSLASTRLAMDDERVSDEPSDDSREERRRSNGSANDIIYELNLIDTPGHVDFSYEVSRSLAACEGAILVVDASQGIQAQTLANVYLAMEADLKIIPVLNKIDLPAADIPRVSREIINLLGCEESDILKISAKTGLNVEKVLDAVVEQIPPPISPLAVNASEVKRSNLDRHADKSARDDEIPLRALIFDSYYDDYRGVILYIRVVDGSLKKNDQIHMIATSANGIALEIGKLSPGMTPFSELKTGEIGYIVTNLKTTRDARVGDTVSLTKYFVKDQK